MHAHTFVSSFHYYMKTSTKTMYRFSCIIVSYIIFAFLSINSSQSVKISKFTSVRIKAAIGKFEESGRVLLFQEWPPYHQGEEKLDEEEYSSPAILIWDVLRSFDGALKNGLTCPFCEANGECTALRSSGMWTNDSNTKCLYPARLIYGTSQPILLVSAVYICARGHQVPAHNPSVISSLPSTTYIPFYLTNRAGVSLDLLTEMCSLVDHGLAFTAIEDVIRDQYEQNYFRQKQRYLTDAETVDNTSFSEMTSYPNRKIIKDVFIAYSAMLEDLFINDFKSRTSKWLFCDHTFKSAANIGYFRESDDRWIRLFRCVFCILGADGDILSWKFTRGESFEEVRELMVELKHRLTENNVVLEGIVIDNCCKWKRMLSSIFPDVPVKLDLFHAVQRFTNTLPVSVRYGSGVGKQYGLIFRRPSDLGDTRTQSTADPSTILQNLKSFESRWSGVKWNGRDIFTESTKKAIENLKMHIEKGCLSEIPVSCSTSKNERLHRNMNSILRTNRISHELAYYRCSRLFFRLNNKKSDNLSAALCCPKKQNIKSDVKEQGSAIFGQTGELAISHIYKSIKELTSEKLYSLKSIILCAMEHFEDEAELDHNYGISNTTLKREALEIAIDSLNFFEVYNGLKEMGCSRFLKNSQLPTSIGLGNLPAKKMSKLKNHSENTDIHESQFEDIHMTNDSNLIGHLTAFGLQLVPIEGDGNCFFSSVAFQVSNLLNSQTTHPSIVSHLCSLGITSNMTLIDLGATLRRLLVEEWRGPNAEDYMSFLPSTIDYLAEVGRYEKSTYFGGPVGDLMPVAMSNLLGIPLCIITPEFHTPIISVCPSRTIGTPIPLFLAYTSSGPGHYDAAVINQEQPNDIHTADSATDPQVRLPSEDNNPTSMELVKEKDDSTKKDGQAYSCRCGSKKKVTGKRNKAYFSNNRCRCILKNRTCSNNCKCLGNCGGRICKSRVISSSQKKYSREPRKKLLHVLQKSRRKLSFSDNKQHLNSTAFNFLEVCAVCAIMQQLLKKGKKCDGKDVLSCYDLLVNCLLDIGIVLPLDPKSVAVIEKELKKIKKDLS